MSYSCADFVNDCDQNADHFEVPDLTAEQRDMMGLPDDQETWCEAEQLRALAERVAGAMSDRADMLVLLREVQQHFVFDPEGDLTRAEFDALLARFPT